jgi:uncharacterized membrane protein YidH (DUF202 family)
MSHPLYDEGLQPERTELAWRRTTLSFGVAALVGFRLLSEAFGDPSWSLPVLFAIVAAGALWLAVHRRYKATNAALLGDRAHELPSGILLLTVAVMTFLIALGGLAAAIVLLFERS